MTLPDSAVSEVAHGVFSLFDDCVGVVGHDHDSDIRELSSHVCQDLFGFFGQVDFRYDFLLLKVIDLHTVDTDSRDIDRQLIDDVTAKGTASRSMPVTKYLLSP